MRFEVLLLTAVISHAGGGLLRQSGPPPEGEAPAASLTISLPVNTLKVGSAILLKAELKNVSEHDIGLMRPPNLAYQTQVRDSAGRLVKPVFQRTSYDKNGRPVKKIRVYSGGVRVISLPPGKGATDILIVSDDFQLTEPGKYSLQVTWQDPETKAIVKSNSVTLTLTP